MSIQNLSFTTFNILSATKTQDIYGTSVINYGTYLSDIQGRQNYLNGQEYFSNGKENVIPTHKIFFETILNIDESYLIVDQSGNKYDILHINHLGEYAGVHHLEILCKKINAYNLI